MSRIGNSEVRVVGTQFNLRHTNGELEVVVCQGKVNVVPDSTVTPVTTVPRVELAPGDRPVVKTSENQVVVAKRTPSASPRGGPASSASTPSLHRQAPRDHERLPALDPHQRPLPRRRHRDGPVPLRELQIDSIVEPDRIVLR